MASYPSSAILRCKRLHYLARVLVDAVAIIPALVQMTAHIPNSWAAVVRADLQWVWIWDEDMELLPDPEVDTSPWEEYICLHRRTWHAKINKLMQRVKEGDIPDDDGEPLEDKKDSEIYCSRCDRVFTTPQGYYLHAKKAHGRVSLVRAYAGIDVHQPGRCVACLKVFGNRQRLLMHLSHGLKKKRSGACVAQIHLNGLATLTEEQIGMLDELDAIEARINRKKGRSQAYSANKVVAADGPTLPAVMGPLPRSFAIT
eukprot:TRINITY_DN29037_c0_g1_i1.p1 TRINITY_DN29037_c0_g1~~TRINITY_DN29037_c0_g1_i1.p1  ORF type:complete len:257 (+),score=39.93 TRINITY_DN29037_c0_g1_i1:465-1235(+)